MDRPHSIDSAADHGSVIEIVGWCLGIFTVIIVLCRLGTKFKVSRILALDDGLIVTSLVLALCQTGSLSAGVSNGTGALSQPSPNQLQAQEKAMYAFNILFILSQWFAKCSILVFIRAITPVEFHRRILLSIFACSTVWAFISVFAISFQCQVPNPWSGPSLRCIDRTALVTFIGIVNILLDLALVVLPAIIVAGLQQALSRKLVIIATFSTRIGAIAAIVFQLTTLYRPQGTAAQDNPLLGWTFALATQIVEYTSIASACGPYLKPFLENIGSGMIASDDLARRDASTATSSRKGLGRAWLRAKTSELTGTSANIKLPKVANAPLAPAGGVNQTTITADGREMLRSNSNTWDSESQRSTSRFIHHTTTYQVTHERA